MMHHAPLPLPAGADLALLLLLLLMMMMMMNKLQVHAQTLLLLPPAVVCRMTCGPLMFCGPLCAVWGPFLLAAAALGEARTCCLCHDQQHPRPQRSRAWEDSKRSSNSSNAHHVRYLNAHQAKCASC
jgi:hypothetical protein